MVGNIYERMKIWNVFSAFFFFYTRPPFALMLQKKIRYQVSPAEVVL